MIVDMQSVVYGKCRIFIVMLSVAMTRPIMFSVGALFTIDGIVAEGTSLKCELAKQTRSAI
jgi:hypothetical protein